MTHTHGLLRERSTLTTTRETILKHIRLDLNHLQPHKLRRTLKEKENLFQLDTPNIAVCVCATPKVNESMLETCNSIGSGRGKGREREREHNTHTHRYSLRTHSPVIGCAPCHANLHSNLLSSPPPPSSYLLCKQFLLSLSVSLINSLSPVVSNMCVCVCASSPYPPA